MENTGDEFNAAVAAELRAQRGRVKVTIDTLVRETHLSKSAVLNYLNDRRDIPMHALYSLCRVLGISPADVMDLAERAVGSANVAGRRNDYGLVANESINEFPEGNDTDFDHA